MRQLQLPFAVLVMIYVAVNVIAFRHAYLMTHFSCNGTRTERPEALSLLEKIVVLSRGISLPKPKNELTPKDIGLKFETHRFLGAFDIPLEAWRIRSENSKGLVLMFHGYAASKQSLLPAAKILHEAGYDTLLVDFFGSGGSKGNRTSIGYHEAADVLGAVNYAREVLGNSEPILYGVSMGGAAILRAVHVYDLVPGAIITEAPFGRMLSTVRNRFRVMGVPWFPGANILVFWGGIMADFDAFTHNPAEYASSVRCPALLLAGAEDTRVSKDESSAIFTKFQGSKEFKLFKGLQHQDFVTARSEEWESTVTQFLEAI